MNIESVVADLNETLLLLDGTMEAFARITPSQIIGTSVCIVSSGGGKSLQGLKLCEARCTSLDEEDCNFQKQGLLIYDSRSTSGNLLRNKSFKHQYFTHRMYKRTGLENKLYIKCARSAKGKYSNGLPWYIRQKF
ncbi:hypothetical protein [Borrelia sp. P9F1]|uniref:hypothetical protein n=1 Tax=Borrelia sp. P9F1 TaxID=3058374 RepID=UPI0026493093|nr:hypothetical protein [Borrelia sp. P9F1]WKC57812.1 hypothetical protein QYZ68_01205 [Borrelia sp. P9F1]